MFSSRSRHTAPLSNSQPFAHKTVEENGFEIVVNLTAHNLAEAESDLERATRLSLESFEAERLATEFADHKLAEAERKLAEAERKLAEAERKLAEAERKLAEADRDVAEAKQFDAAAYLSGLTSLGLSDEEARALTKLEGTRQSELEAEHVFPTWVFNVSGKNNDCILECFARITGDSVEAIRRNIGKPLGEMGTDEHIESFCSQYGIDCEVREFNSDWTLKRDPQTFRASTVKSASSRKCVLCLRRQHYTLYVGK